MSLKYMSLPLDSDERALILTHRVTKDVLDYPMQRFSDDTFSSLRGEIVDMCQFYSTDFFYDLRKFQIRLAECRSAEKGKLFSKLGRKNKKGVRVLLEESSPYYRCLINALKKELAFRMDLVSSCVEWAGKMHSDKIRPEKIGRRIVTGKNVWPFPRYEPGIVRVRRTRSEGKLVLKPEFPKTRRWSDGDADDLENVFE